MSDPSLTLTPKQAAGLTAKFVLFQIGFFVLIGIVSGFRAAINGRHPPADGGIDPVSLLFVNSLAAFLVLRGQLQKSQLPWSEFFRARSRWIMLLPAFAFIMIGEVVTFSEAGNWMMFVMPPPQWLRAQFAPMNDLVGHPFSAPFDLIVVAAVTEEFLFRGLILRGLMAKISPARAVAISAGLFALMHLNPWQMPLAFILGLVFGWVYLRTRSLALCIAGHGFHNAVSLLAAGLPFTIDGFNREHAPTIILFQPWWFNLLGVAAFALGACFFHRAAPAVIWTPPPETGVPPLPPITTRVAEVPVDKA